MHLLWQIYMNNRNLGKTNINLNAIGFGGAPLGDLFENLEEPNCFELLKKCYEENINLYDTCLLYTSPSPRDATLSRMPSSA